MLEQPELELTIQTHLFGGINSTDMRNITLSFIAFLSLISVTMQGQDLTVNTFADAHHTGANTINQSFTFPNDISIYDSIVMNIALTCPTGGCDPWDRFATIKVVKGGEEFEIGRYATPYGNGWCDWQLDVTDYRDFLTGNVEMESYIETWSNGWLVTVDFDFYLGTPSKPYVAVQNLWVDYYFIYGDTIFYSLDLPARNVVIPNNAEDVKLRIVNTGHGQGNTDNAAEFSQRTHQINLDGTTAFNQFLWKSDCNVNPCSPQAGTWEFSRAGWCPGQEIKPDDYDLNTLVSPGQAVEIDYVLESSFNECSPWNPPCQSGVTCTDCNYNGGTHTQPNYKISAQLIVASSTPVVITGVDAMESSNRIKIYPNPNNGMVNLQVDLKKEENINIAVYDMSGRQVHTQQYQNVLTTTKAMDLTALPKGLYMVVANTPTHQIQQKIVIEKND